MAEQCTSTSRVLFKKGKQQLFILESKEKIGVPYKELAKLLNISKRTLADWKREKFLMSFKAVNILAKAANIEILKDIEIKDSHWHIHDAAVKGGKATYKKYKRIGGDPKKRKELWYRWWENEGKYKQHPFLHKSISIKKPRKSRELAELVGALLGDGGISAYQVTITLHHRDDRKYADFISQLMRKLFEVPVALLHRPKESTINCIVSRRQFVLFCINSLGLKQGNKIKNQIDIPDWIKNSKQFSLACVRGLVDTDGSIFTHSYRVKGKRYSYKKLGFTSASIPLRKSVYKILKENNLNPRYAGKYDIRIDSIVNMERYFKIVGTSNPKHLRRYKE